MRYRPQTALALPALLALALAGCQRKTAEPNTADALSANASNVVMIGENDAPLAANEQVTSAPPASGFASNGQATASTTASDDPIASGTALPPPTASDAASVVGRYYAALDRGDFRAAYALWGNDGQDSHQSFADFKRGFAGTAATSVTTGTPTNGEGAAGSIYIDVPVTVSARLKDGKRQRFVGHYTLRRVNDVPGSTAEQRRWHLYDADLKAT